MSKRTVLIPLDGSSFSRQILHVVRDYFRPEDVDIVLMRVSTPVLLTAESQTYADIVAEQSYMGMYGSYTPHQERQWAMATQESETYRAELQGDLENEAERLREQGYRVSTEVHFGEPAQRIIDFVNDMNINVVAMATHGRTGLGRLVLGSVAEKVLRGVAVPVLLWRSTATTSASKSAAESLAEGLEQERPLQIAVATDGSTFTRHAVVLARELATALCSPLTLLVTAAAQDDVKQSQQLTQDAAQFVEGMAQEVQVVPLVGYTDEVVLNYLGAKPIDLLVIGGFQDRGTGASHAIGATAHRIVQHAPTSVLMMKGAHTTIQRILVAAALDDEVVVKVASHLGHRLGAQLDLLHILPATAASYLTATENGELTTSAVLKQNTHLASVIRGWIQQLSVVGYGEENLHLYRGEALNTILNVARHEQYDLVIVGSQSGAGHFLGSVANGVVQFTDQSVLVVRTQPR